ncbi:High choriolytic enzyme 1 [Liparis tanakae]|uniref:Metalloendopeptidase n=1 Tax=Liparis tanakae TaxID=230148 RepID=A0A4Z2EFU9_9TELE|nr:High choriolytic enzyme 1 [Liparis tanakae]
MSLPVRGVLMTQHKRTRNPSSLLFRSDLPEPRPLMKTSCHHLLVPRYKGQERSERRQSPRHHLAMWSFIVASVLLTAGLGAQHYDNRLRGILHRTCPEQQAVSQINSSYSEDEQDRQWKVECKSLGNGSACSWSGPQDVFEEELSYNCPANHVVAGVYSGYDQAEGGRSWKFLCCSAANFSTFECRKTPMVNYWSEDFNWQLPVGHFLTGVQTHHKNHDNGDHRWSFNFCKGETQETQTVNSQILTANVQVEEGLEEGDVLVSNARNARVCEDCRWTKDRKTVKVPYAVSDSFSASEKLQIENAISDFHMSTCIRFVPRTSQSDFISIVEQGGCWSWVGRTGNAQQLSLGRGCLYKGIIQHELIHALGFWHEQSRSDRDTFVRINFGNILPGQERNFKRMDTNNLDVPYDYSSVMHYGPRDFSSGSGDTITPLDTSALIGQRHGMSENDILKINKLYNCTDYLHKFTEWDNKLEDTLSRTCPSSQAVSGLTSLYNNDKKDRLWAFSCKAFNVKRTCKWSRPVNQVWASMSFRCGANEVIAGVYSVYSNLFQDRKYGISFNEKNKNCFL